MQPFNGSRVFKTCVCDIGKVWLQVRLEITSF